MGSQAAQTALGPMVIVAVDRNDEAPLTDDALAYRLLPAGMRLGVTVTRWSPLRRAMIRATERKLPGMWASFLCRKRYIDDSLHDAARSGLDAVVSLGAGLDTRAYRLPALAETPVYEIDLPGNIERKRALLARLYGEVPEHVTLVPVDFETQNLQDVLAAYGYWRDHKTFFVWEAVTQYLTEEGVRRTFDFLAGARAGSSLVFTYIRKDFLDGIHFYGAEAGYREYVAKRRLWRFGMDPDQVAGFLAEYGWREVEHVGPRVFTDRYVRPSGRDLPVSEVERSVRAGKI